jgi:hypothetical protein
MLERRGLEAALVDDLFANYHRSDHMVGAHS